MQAHIIKINAGIVKEGAWDSKTGSERSKVTWAKMIRAIARAVWHTLYITPVEL